MHTKLITALVLSAVAYFASAAPATQMLTEDYSSIPSIQRSQDFQIKLPVYIRRDNSGFPAFSSFEKRVDPVADADGASINSFHTADEGNDEGNSNHPAPPAPPAPPADNQESKKIPYTSYTGTVSAVAGVGSLGVAAANYAGTNHTK